MLKTPEAALCRVLMADPVFALRVGMRLSPVLASASTPMPFVVWQRTSIERDQGLSGPVGMPKVSCDFIIHAETYKEARQVADAMRLVLDGYGGTVHNVVVNQVYLDSESDDFVTLAGSEMPPAYQITQGYTILWQET